MLYIRSFHEFIAVCPFISNKLFNVFASHVLSKVSLQFLLVYMYIYMLIKQSK